MSKHRISKVTLSKLPTPVAQAIKEVQQRYSEPNGKPYFSSFTYYTKNEGFQLWHGEGESITYIYNEQQVSAEVASENNYSGSKIGYGPKLPVGTVAITVGYMSGYYMTVYNVGYAGIEGSI